MSKLREFKENCSINDKLIDDVLLMIFNNLSITDKFKIRRVCKDWKRLIDHLLNKQNDLVIIRKGDKLFTCNNLKKVSQLDYIYYDDYHYDYDYTCHRHIFHEPGKRNHDKMVKQLLSKCTNLKTLCIKSLEKPIGLTEFCCQKLENLIIGFCFISNWEDDIYDLNDIILSIVSKCGQNLKYVEICGNISSNCLEFFIKNTPNLEAFSIFKIYHPSKNCFSYFHDKLEQFSLACRTEDDDDIIKSLCKSKCKNLKRFYFGSGINKSKLNAKELQMICENFVFLTEIRIYCNVSDKDDLKTITKLHNLEKISLVISEHFEYCDHSLSEILKSCRKLKEIEIYSTRGFSNDCVKNIGYYCPFIEILEIYMHTATKITDEGLNEISKLSNLKELSISGASITDHGLIKLMSKCDLIKKLGISYCSKITNKFRDFCIEFAKTRPTKNLEITAHDSHITVETDIELPKNLRFYP